MAKARTVFLGAGCLLVVFGFIIMVVLVRGLAAPSLPREMVVSLRLAGPIAEVTAEDPFAELMGDQATSLSNLRSVLNRAAEDDRVRGIRLRIDSIGGGFATAQELRSLIARVGAAGKWTAAYMDTAGEFMPGNLVYYVASACDEVSMNPQGDLNLIGISSRTPFIRGTFDKLDIQAEFPGRGDYKTARFMYTETEFTPEQEEMTGWLIDSLMEQMTVGIGDSRGMTAEEVRNLIDRAPFIGEESVEAGLIDRLEDWGSFNERLDEREPNAREIGVRAYLHQSGKVHRGPKIAVVTGVGAIMRGASGESFNPLLGGEIMGSETISKAFRDVGKTPGVEAVVFRIDSPGGSAVASEIIRQEMARVAAEVPVVVSEVARKKPVYVDDARFLRSETDHPVKFTLPGPMTMVDTLYDDYYRSREKLAWEFAKILNQEARGIAAAGVDVIQFDEPAFNVFFDEVRDWGVKTLERAAEGLPCKTAVHICYGYGIKENTEWKKTLGSEWRQYEETFPLLRTSKIDQVSLECHNSKVPIALIELLEGKDVLVGAIDVTTDRVETPEEVAETVRKALAFVAPEKLFPCTNCGMVPLARTVARAKLKALAAGAAMVRKELAKS